MTEIKIFTFNPFEENTYVLSVPGGDALIIDPGCYEKEEQLELAAYLESERLNVKYLLNTHCHIDHVLGNAFVKNKYHVSLMLHPLERPVLKAVSSYASNYGFPQYQETSPDLEFQEGEKIHLGSTELEILWLPGHSPGHVAFYSKEEKFMIGGDVLFFHSVGRTDLPGGNHETLLRSIREKLFKLPDDVIVYPGHGPMTTLGEEKVNNPFCALTFS